MTDRLNTLETADDAHALRLSNDDEITLLDVVSVSRHGRRVQLGSSARSEMAGGAKAVASAATSPHAVYGVNTGVGHLASARLAAVSEDREQCRQQALIRSHAAGMGDAIERDVVRAMMLLRARTLARSRSGARPEVVDLMIQLLNADITPIVPEYGSLGASGDLAPLAHCALALLGEGDVLGPHGEVQAAGLAMSTLGITPIHLRSKEALSLINGTDGMLAMLVLVVHDIKQLVKISDVTAAMSIEALLGHPDVFSADLIALRPQRGQAESAANLLRMLVDSHILRDANRPADQPVQDAYSLRCVPQVAGAVRETLAHATRIAETELASTIDNPVVMPDGAIRSCGNIHGASLAYACDFLAIAIADLGAMAERRTDRLLDPSRSNGLPPFLAVNPGEDSGLMIAQYTQAALVADNRRLAAPASVESASTSAGQEDHVSMGWSAARKLRVSLTNLARIQGIELLAATVGLQFRTPLQPARGTAAALDAVRAEVPAAATDRWVAPDLVAAHRLVSSGTITRAVEAAIGPLL